MLPPPPVTGTWCPVHRPFYKAVEGRLLGAGSVTPPPVLLVQLHLVMEGVVDTDAGPGGRVDPVHVLVELGPVTVVVVIVVGDEEEGVDHLVQQRLHQVLPGPEFQERDGDPDGAEPLSGRIPADTSAGVHPGRPAHLAHHQLPPEESLVELLEESVEVRGGVDGLPLRGDAADWFGGGWPGLAGSAILGGQEWSHLNIGALHLKLLLQPPGQLQAGLVLAGHLS